MSPGQVIMLVSLPEVSMRSLKTTVVSYLRPSLTKLNEIRQKIISGEMKVEIYVPQQ